MSKIFLSKSKATTSGPRDTGTTCATRSLTSDEAGLSMLEAALVLPIVFGLFFAVIQYGFLFGAFISLRNAVAVVARTSAISDTPVPNATLEQMISEASPLLERTNVTVVTNEHRSATISGVSLVTRLGVEYRLRLFFPMVVPQADANGDILMTVDLVAREN